MTSNVGAQTIRHQGSLGFRQRSTEQDYEAMKHQLMTEMEKEFKPEFINRLDEVVVFRSLTREDLHQIVDIEYAKVVKRLREHDIEVEMTAEAKDLIIEKGYSPDYGARPLRRQVERLVEDPLSEELLRCNIKGGCRIRIQPSEDETKLDFIPIEEPEALASGAASGGIGSGSGTTE
jgi:ATP-dependent Clp protease ATP-binding subunit ClpC